MPVALRFALALILFVALDLAVGGAAPAWNTTPDAAYLAYANGDDGAVERWVASLPPKADAWGTFPALQADAPWNRMAAAFLLEVAAARPSHVRAEVALARGQAMVLRRPAPLGASPDEDLFEVTWHHAALALLQHGSRTSRKTYLSNVIPRFEEAAERGVRVQTRFALAQAMAAGTVEAISLFDRAAEQPHLRAEALIRAGKLLLEGGLFTDALARLESVPPEADPTFAFVRHLTHGRILDALHRPRDAAREYARALKVRPDAQLAAIGLAAAHLRTGNRADAVRIADDARRMPPLPERGFEEFQSGDARFVEGWIADIRRTRR